MGANENAMDISQTGAKKPTGVTGLTNEQFFAILDQLKKSKGYSVTVRFDPEDEMDLVRLRKYRERLQHRLYGYVNNTVITRIDKKELTLNVWLE